MRQQTSGVKERITYHEQRTTRKVRDSAYSHFSDCVDAVDWQAILPLKSDCDDWLDDVVDHTEEHHLREMPSLLAGRKPGEYVPREPVITNTNRCPTCLAPLRGDEKAEREDRRFKFICPYCETGDA